MKSEFLTSPTDITATWLTNRLRQNGFLATGEVQNLTWATLQKDHLAITVSYSSDAGSSLPCQFILKRYGNNYPYGVHEGEFYKRVAGQMPHPPVPFCYDVLIDYTTLQTQILIEDLSSTYKPAATVVDVQQLEASLSSIVDVYAKFHAYWWDHPNLSRADFLQSDGIGVSHAATSATAISENRLLFMQKVAPQFFEQHDGKIPAGWQELCLRAIDAWTHLFSSRMEQGKAFTLIHGDAHLNNIMLPQNSVSGTPILIDWEGWVRGIGAWDLTRILTYCIHPEVRAKLDKQLWQRYHTHLLHLGVENYSYQDCIEDYRLSIVAAIPHAMAWTGLTHLAYTLSAFADWGCHSLLV